MIIPIFIHHRGCPHRCLYCNERVTAETSSGQWTYCDFEREVESFLTSVSSFEKKQIAFYGGNFTGLSVSEQSEFLKWCQPYLHSRKVDSVRISTRPDFISEENAQFLWHNGVRTVELGVQSMNDELLKKIERGHTKEDVEVAVKTLQRIGFEVGVHLMLGLPGETKEEWLNTVNEIIRLRPQMVRIHPLLVLKDTALEVLYKSKKFIPISLDEAIEWCSEAIERFIDSKINVIRLGLHITQEMQKVGSVVAGPVHFSFGTLVYENFFLRKAFSLVQEFRTKNKIHKYIFMINPKAESFIKGHRKSNFIKLAHDLTPSIVEIKTDPTLALYEVRLCIV